MLKLCFIKAVENLCVYCTIFKVCYYNWNSRKKRCS